MSAQKIRFCPVCDNKYYHQLSTITNTAKENNKDGMEAIGNKNEDGTIDMDRLVYSCRVCGHEDENFIGACVLNIQYDNKSADSTNYQNIVNRYTKFDPTLPHIEIPCPNEECKTNKNNDPTAKAAYTDALYIRYDNIQMKHLYLCTTCDFIWKTHDV
jgi:hypothetical protein